MIDHFNFRHRPFTREIAAEQHFQLPFIDKQIAELTRCIEMRASGLLISPAGMGKTSLIRQVVSKLADTQYKVSYINVTSVSGRDLCRDICQAVGARRASTYPALVRSIQEVFVQNHKDSAIHSAIIFDDAQSLRATGFEALKFLSNFNMDSKLGVSFILLGHNSLKDKLHRADLEDVRQRMVHCGELRALTHDESSSYIEHRLNVAGGTNGIFTAQAFEAIYLISRGNMRAIDNLALKALINAAEAKEPAVNTQHVSAARSQLWN